MNETDDGGRRRERILGGLLLLFAATAGQQGCSFVLTDGPPPKAQRTPGFTCTESPVVPSIDIALSVLSFAETVHATAKGRTPLPWLGASLAFGASAGVGGIRVNACNKAHGHPYVPHAPTAQPDMMPELPFGVRGAHPDKPPKPGDDDDEPVQEPAGPPAPEKPPQMPL